MLEPEYYLLKGKPAPTTRNSVLLRIKKRIDNRISNKDGQMIVQVLAKDLLKEIDYFRNQGYNRLYVEGTDETPELRSMLEQHFKGLDLRS